MSNTPVAERAAKEPAAPVGAAGPGNGHATGPKEQAAPHAAEPGAAGPGNGHANGHAEGPNQQAAAQGPGSDSHSGEPAAGEPGNGHFTAPPSPKGEKPTPPQAPVVEALTAPGAGVNQTPAPLSATPSNPSMPSPVLPEHAGAAPVFPEVDLRGANGGQLIAGAAAPALPAVDNASAFTLSEPSLLTVWGTASPSGSALGARPSGSAVGARPSSAPPLPAPGGATASGGAGGAAASALFGLLLSFAAFCLLHHMRLREATGMCRAQAFVALIERPG